MQELLNKAENERIIFVEDFRDLKFVDTLAEKKLCIIKTDFKDINQIKKFCKAHPDLEVWLASNDISRKNILSANSCGVKNVVSYPVETKLIHEFFKKKDRAENLVNIQHTYNDFLKGLKIMIVDDNKMNIDLLVETLSQMGLEISTFIKPKEACKIVHQQNFDLFLLDIMMPEMSGFDLAKEIKSSGINSHTPIMFISALSDPENKIRSYNMGSCAYIEKPFNVNIVRSQIYSALKTKTLQDALNNRKESFLAMVTHDLKTPVNAEICALEILLDSEESKLNGFQQEIVDDMLGAAKYMKHLVDNVLCKYKVDSGNIVLNKKNYSMKTLVIECIEEIKYLFLDKKQNLIFNCGVRNSELSIDYIEIKRVIHNLLINANEYGCRDSNIELELAETQENIIFSVKNYSNCIHIDDTNIIFNKDFTGHDKQKSVGTGLGLYISKNIIEAHKGTIAVETEENQFAKMIITLPKA